MRIHVGWYASGGEVFSDEPLRSVPVEVVGGVTDTREVDTGCGWGGEGGG